MAAGSDARVPAGRREVDTSMSLEGFDLGEVIAQSSTTTVRRGTRKSDAAPVVIKSFSRAYVTAQDIGQLEFEYRVLRKLESPGVIRALDLVKEGDRPLLVLEDFGGRSLAARPERKMPLAEVFS